MPINDEQPWSFSPRSFDIPAADRIAELASAIISATRSKDLNRNLIAAAQCWAYELTEQLGLMDTMRCYTDAE